MQGMALVGKVDNGRQWQGKGMGSTCVVNFLLCSTKSAWLMHMRNYE